jgi:hypothetical protein
MQDQTKMNQEFLRTLIGALFQAEADSRAVVVGVALRPQGLAMSGEAEVRADTPTSRYFKNVTVASGTDLGSLPGGQTDYWTMVLSPEVLNAPAWLRCMMLGTACGAKAVDGAFAELVAAKPRMVLEDFSFPLCVLKVYHYQDQTAAAATLKLFEAFDTGVIVRSGRMRGGTRFPAQLDHGEMGL